MGIAASRPEFFRFENGAKAPLPFSPAEYERRIDALRRAMGAADIPAVLLTSMQNVACFSGFLNCSFGRSYALVVTADRCTTVSANIDGGQPWRRSHGDNLAYTDWKRGNFWRAVRELVVAPGRLGIETDHLTLSIRDQLIDFLGAVELVDVGASLMAERMIKSPEEIALIREGARIADIGGAATRLWKAQGKSTWRWPATMPSRARSLAPFPIPKCAKPGSGFSRVSTPTAPRISPVFPMGPVTTLSIEPRAAACCCNLAPWTRRRSPGASAARPATWSGSFAARR